MTEKEIKKVFERFSAMNIMIIGDVMVDSYLWGKVERISPEAPIPIVSVVKRESRLGGAANVALNIQSLGANPLLCSITGNDAKKDIFLGLMQDKGMITDGILVREDRKTTVKTRIIGSGQHLLRVDEENNERINRDTEDQFIALIRSVFASVKTDAVIFEDYDKGVVTPGIIKEVISLAGEKGIPVAADPKKRNFGYYTNIDLFKPNFKELSEGLREDISRTDIEAIGRAARRLQEKNNIRCLLVTLSEMGIYLRTGDRGALLPTEIRDIADVSGAGDTVISVATACLAAGVSPENMARIANLAGGLVCEKVGVVPIDRQLLLRETLDLLNW